MFPVLPPFLSRATFHSVFGDKYLGLLLFCNAL